MEIIKDGEYLITKYDNGTVVKEIDQTGKAPIIIPRTLSRYQFNLRFTFSEQMAISTSTDAGVISFRKTFMLAEEVNLDDSGMESALGYLTSSGVLAEGRKTEIVA